MILTLPPSQSTLYYSNLSKNVICILPPVRLYIEKQEGKNVDNSGKLTINHLKSKKDNTKLLFNRNKLLVAHQNTYYISFYLIK